MLHVRSLKFTLWAAAWAVFVVNAGVQMARTGMRPGESAVLVALGAVVAVAGVVLAVRAVQLGVDYGDGQVVVRNLLRTYTFRHGMLEGVDEGRMRVLPGLLGALVRARVLRVYVDGDTVNVHATAWAAAEQRHAVAKALSQLAVVPERRTSPFRE